MIVRGHYRPVGAIAIPNFVKARATSQANACINTSARLMRRPQFALGEKGKRPVTHCMTTDLTPTSS